MSSNQPSAGNINDKQGSSTPTSDDMEMAFALALEGNECMKAYKHKEAFEKLSQAIALNPDPLLICSRASLYCTLEQYDDAINECLRAIEVDPKCAEAYCQLGLTFDVLTRYGEAIEAFKKALKLDPEDEDSRRGLVSAEQKLKDETQSSPSTEDIATANALKEQGNEYMKDSKFNEAIEKYTQAIALKRDPVYFCNRSAAYCRLHNYYEALKDGSDAVLLDPNYAKARARMGFISSCQGRYLYSVRFYKQALELDPNNQSYKENFALAEVKVRAANHRS